MDFRIESQWHDSPEPKSAKDLKAALEHARDLWLEKTPQDHDPASVEAGTLAAALYDVEQVRLQAKDDKGAEQLRKANERYAAHVKNFSAKPTPEMAGAIALIDDGIEMACARATSSKAPAFRVSICGHFRAKALGTHGLHGAHERLTVQVDDATYG